jgi:diacylglycerol kinase (ATP)
VSRRVAAVIVNPRAWRGGADWQVVVREELGEWDVELLHPSDAAAATDLARDARASGYDLVVAAGGDGTINAIANGLADTGVPLGIIPLGTANDLARELGIPGDARAAARHIARAAVRAVDLVTVNGRAFCTVGGIALVSRSAMAVTRWKDGAPSVRRMADVLGGGIYRLAATACLLSPRAIVGAISIEFQEPESDVVRTVTFNAHALFVANHRTLGGGLVLPIDGNAHDGVFELCVVPERSRPSLVVNFARLSAGTPLPTGVLLTMRATSAVIRCDVADAFVADGELLAEGREFKLGCRRGALLIKG